MEKFSLFDFVSFILPGCTFLILGNLLLGNQDIAWMPKKLPDWEVIVIPLLFAGYLVGHLLSLLGKQIERWMPSMKMPWLTYLKKHPDQAEIINAQCLSKFNKGFFNESKEIDIHASDKMYDMIYDYIELQDKDEKIKILYSQYGFFRNAAAVWLTLCILLISLLALKISGATFVTTSINLMSMYSTITATLVILSLILCKKRKLVTMYYVYRTFFVMNISKG